MDGWGCVESIPNLIRYMAAGPITRPATTINIKEVRVKGNIISRDGDDEAQFFIRFKGIERYHEYHSIREFTRDWRDQDEWMDEEVRVLERPKSEARRQIDLFLKRIKHIPTDKAGFDSWKANDDIYQKGGMK